MNGNDTKDQTMEYAGNGMSYDIYNDHESSLCKRNWLKNMFFVNNFMPLADSCQLHTWYLAVDMQLFVLTIPLVVCYIIYTRFDATPGKMHVACVDNVALCVDSDELSTGMHKLPLGITALMIFGSLFAEFGTIHTHHLHWCMDPPDSRYLSSILSFSPNSYRLCFVQGARYHKRQTVDENEYLHARRASRTIITLVQ